MWRNYSVRLGLLLFAIMLIVGCTQARELSVEDIWARPGIQDANSAVYFVVANTSGETDTLLSAESEIASAVELHESMLKPVDEGQGGMAKPVEDRSNKVMEAHHHDTHHEDGDIEYQEYENGENCEDHQDEGEHHDAHHEDGDMDCQEHEDSENCEDQHGECEDHDDHHGSEVVGNSMEGSMGADIAGEVMMMVQQENVPVGAQSQIEFKPGGLHVMLIGLNQDLKPGETFQVTLNFEKAGPITMDVPVKQP
jgi:copper(I)-binding protein